MVEMSTERLFPSSLFGKLCEDNQWALFEIQVSALEALGPLDRLLRKAHIEISHPPTRETLK